MYTAYSILTLCRLKILLLCSLLQGALLSCECPKTSTCPLLLYEDGRAVKDHLFKPCEQSCDICVDGWSAQIESINCPKNSALECACASSNNGDVHLKPVSACTSICDKFKVEFTITILVYQDVPSLTKLLHNHK